MPIAEGWKKIEGQLRGREDEIRKCAKSNTPFYVGGEAFFFHQLISTEGEMVLLKSYWDGEPTGLKKLKVLVKRSLIRWLNNW
jgi:hypothetical protein